jgi:hypothetical protein
MTNTTRDGDNTEALVFDLQHEQFVGLMLPLQPAPVRRFQQAAPAVSEQGVCLNRDDEGGGGGGQVFRI